MNLDDIITTLQGSGCSPFFFTSALQSLLFGEMGRSNQAQILESNLEFKARMQEIKTQYSKERIDEQKTFRRENYELGRQYLIQQTTIQNMSRRKQIDFQNFIKNYWPLERDPFSILMEQRQHLEKQSVIPLTVLIAKTGLICTRRDTSKYDEFCESLITEFERLPNVIIEKSPWKSECQSRLGEAMNINYLMGGIPTLIIFPYEIGSTLGIETVSWTFGRGLQSMNHNKTFIFEGVTLDAKDNIVFAAVKATIGMTRDAYMLAEYHKPTLFNHIVDERLLEIPEICKQLEFHYADMAKLITSSEFQQLCTSSELSAILSSINSNLLKA